MKIEYDSHYDEAYWKAQKEYRDAQGNTQKYQGPSLDWDGFDIISGALASVLPVVSPAPSSGNWHAGTSLLDIGCGGGGLTSRLLGRGFDAYGCEISEYAIDHCVPAMRGRVAHADITSCPHELRGKDLLLPAQFDVLIATDLLEHLYEEDLERTFEWMMSKTKKWMFFCVATALGPDVLFRTADKVEFVLKKGFEVPPEFESAAVAGHVNVRSWKYWVAFFESKGLRIRWDLGYIFQMFREMHPGWRDTMGWNMQTTWFLEKP